MFVFWLVFFYLMVCFADASCFALFLFNLMGNACIALETRVHGASSTHRHSFVTYLPLEVRKSVLGLDHCVSDPDIGVGPAPPPAARRSLPCRLAPLAWPLPSPPALRSRNVVGGICRSYCGLETNPPRHRGTPTLRSLSANWPRPSLHCQHRPPLPLHQQPLQRQ